MLYMELFSVAACVITAIGYLLLDLISFNGRSNLKLAFDEILIFECGDKRIDFLYTKRAELQILYSITAPLCITVYASVIESKDIIF